MSYAYSAPTINVYINQNDLTVSQMWRIVDARFNCEQPPLKSPEGKVGLCLSLDGEMTPDDIALVENTLGEHKQDVDIRLQEAEESQAQSHRNLAFKAGCAIGCALLGARFITTPPSFLFHSSSSAAQTSGILLIMGAAAIAAFAGPNARELKKRQQITADAKQAVDRFYDNAKQALADHLSLLGDAPTTSRHIQPS